MADWSLVHRLFQNRIPTSWSSRGFSHMVSAVPAVLKMLLDGWEEGVDQGLWGLSPSNSAPYHSAKIMVCVQYLIMVA